MTQAAGHIPERTNRTTHSLDATGLIKDWLVSPAWKAPCGDLLSALIEESGEPWGPNGRWTLTQGPEVAPLKERLHACRPLVIDQALPQIVEGGPVSWIAPGADRTDSGIWTRVHTRSDGLVDWSEFCYLPELRHAVAATVLEVDQPEWRELEVASTGPTAVYVDGALVSQSADVSYMEPIVHTVRLRLGSGLSTLLVATWQVGMREVRHTCRVRVIGLPIRVVIPSRGADEYASRIAEGIVEEVSTRSWALKEPVVALEGPDGARLRVTATSGRSQTLVLEGGKGVLSLLEEAQDDSDQGSASMLSTGETTLKVALDDERCPVFREMRVALVSSKARLAPHGADPALWRREVLEHVASGEPCTARALARSRLAAQRLPPTRDVLTREDLWPSLSMIEQRADCADFEAVGLITLLHRLADDEGWPPHARDEVRQALLGFKYWIDQPGLDAMCYFTENHQLVYHVAELLAGELFPEERFANTGWKGAQHCEHGRSMTLEWIRRKLRGGFSEFDSNAYLAIDSLALVSLVEFSTDPEVANAAEALLHKLLYTLAANSWHGIHGAAHGRSYAQTLRSARFEETAPIMWTLWGTGALNRAVLPATCLALARRYQLPEVIRSVANDFQSPWYGRQVYRGQYSFTQDLLSRPYGSDLRVWKTADAMISSVQDYRSGLPGLQEHIWGATLAPEVQVFATYPGSASDSPSSRPNAWAGQRVLPVARQDRDTVLVTYGPTGHAPTHLWFPAAFMDEVAQVGPWLAGRVGDGYVAVGAAGGFEAVRTGATAYQEWTPRHAGGWYVATVGSRSEDGPFAAFTASLDEPALAEGRLAWTARDGRRLQLSASGFFSVDGHCPDLAIDGTPDTTVHIDNPSAKMFFGDELLVVKYSGHRMAINVVKGTVDAV